MLLNFVLSAFVPVTVLISTTRASEVRVRLVGGPSPREGRLEVYHNGEWGTVCDEYTFTDAAARVVCFMLGYGYVGRNVGDRYGDPDGRIWMKNVRCNGAETDISECLYGAWGSSGRCWYSNDDAVSVSCSTARLVNGSATPRGRGSSPREGRVQVYYNGTWGTVCRSNFTDATAAVICHMLGYEDAGQYIGNRYGRGSGRIWLDNVRCSGTETDIEDCQHSGWGKHSCEHWDDVSVSCFGKVRLVGDSGSKGRLELYHYGRWGTVCDDGFSDAAARVICYSLGYGHTGRAIGNAYGAGSGPIWLDNVRCTGWEPHVTECQHFGWGRHNCQHSEDVSISCIADSTEAVAAVGGGNPRTHDEDVAISCTGQLSETPSETFTRLHSTSMARIVIISGGIVGAMIVGITVGVVYHFLRTSVPPCRF